MTGLALFIFGFMSYDPQILTLTWPDGRTEQVAATSPEVCAAAKRAIEAGYWLKDEGPVSVTCRPGNLFSERSQCITGFNCLEVGP